MASEGEVPAPPPRKPGKATATRIYMAPPHPPTPRGVCACACDAVMEEGMCARAREGPPKPKIPKMKKFKKYEKYKKYEVEYAINHI